MQAISPERTVAVRRGERGFGCPTPETRRLIWDRARLLKLGEGKVAYQPWPEMQEAHESPAQFVLVSGAERVGKSVAAAMEGIAWVPFAKLIWLCAYQYSDTEEEFDNMAEGLLNMGAVKGEINRPRDKGWAMETENGCVIETKTLRDMFSALVAKAPDLIIVCEAGQLKRDPIDKLRLRLSTRRGRCFITGTMEDASPWMPSRFEEWRKWPNAGNGQSFSVPLYANKQDFPQGKQDPEITAMRQTMNPNVYRARVDGLPSKSELLVMNYMWERVGAYPRNARPCPFVERDENGQDKPVEICIDPGYHPSYYAVIALQRHGREVHAFDEIAVQQTSHEVVIERTISKPWWGHVIGGTLDPFAGKSHGFGWETTKAIWEQMTGVELRTAHMPSLEALIERMRAYHGEVSTECRFYFDPQACPLLLDNYGTWRYKRDATGRINRAEPESANCDGMKAVGYWVYDDFKTEFAARFSRSSTPSISPYRVRMRAG